MTGFSNLLLLTTITVALFSCTAWCRQPLIKAPDGAEKTGSFIIVLREEISESAFKGVIEEIKQLSDEVDIQRYTDQVQKTVTVSASRDIIEKVSCSLKHIIIPLQFSYYY